LTYPFNSPEKMFRLHALVLVLASAAAFVLNTQSDLSSARTTPLQMVKRPQLKAAKKANRKRPKKHRPSDINRTPPTFDPEPHLYEGRPPAYTVLKEGSPDFDKNAHIAAALERLAAEPEYDRTDPEMEAKIMAAIKYPDPAQAAVAMAKL